MYKQYQLTDLELWLEDLYKNNNLLSPEDLEIDNIAASLGINVEYLEDAVELAIWNEQKATIYLDPKKPITKIREIFFHELCHPLRHFGDQSFMSKNDFYKLQEIQANHFQLYAAMPFCMIKELPETQYESEMILLLQVTFGVSFNLAKKRFEQIKRRALQHQIDEVVIKENQKVYNIYSDRDRNKWKRVADEIAELAILRKRQKETIQND